jgi:hypothetical protein
VRCQRCGKDTPVTFRVDTERLCADCQRVALGFVKAETTTDNLKAFACAQIDMGDAAITRYLLGAMARRAA